MKIVFVREFDTLQERLEGTREICGRWRRSRKKKR